MVSAAPVLRVADVDRALGWWARLGFVEEFRHRFEGTTPRYVGIRRDGCRIHLSEHEGDAAGPGLVHLWVPDVDAVAREFGVTVDEMPWARDCEVTDHDGNRVRAATARSGDDSAVARLLAGTRADLDRVAATDLAAELAAGALVVDIRPVEQRERDGEMPGAVVVDRNVLEWRLDPTSPDRLDVADSTDLRVVLVCDEGYASSLAAASLRGLGLHRATDLVGGFRAWTSGPGLSGRRRD